jgi:hypothetical protein
MPNTNREPTMSSYRSSTDKYKHVFRRKMQEKWCGKNCCKPGHPLPNMETSTVPCFNDRNPPPYNNQYQPYPNNPPGYGQNMPMQYATVVGTGGLSSPQQVFELNQRQNM